MAGLRSLYVSPRGSENPSARAPLRVEALTARTGSLARDRRDSPRGHVPKPSRAPVPLEALHTRRPVSPGAGRQGRRPRLALLLRPAPRFCGLKETGAWRAYRSARDLTFRSVASGSFLVAGASALRVYSGSAGPAVDVSNVIQAGPRVPTSILIDGLTAAGFRRGAAAREVSCLEVRAVNGLTIRRSRFSNCGDHALLFDLHLKATSAAVDRGDPSNYPASDIDGESGPLGGSRDAGADERQ